MASTGYTGEGTFVIGSGDPTASTQLTCGHFTFAEGADLLHALLKTLHLTAEDRARQPIPDNVVRLGRRIFRDAPGTSASTSRLSEVPYIKVLSVWIDRAPELQRILSAVHDPQIRQGAERHPPAARSRLHSRRPRLGGRHVAQPVCRTFS
jgi:hypothetical protein